MYGISMIWINDCVERRVEADAIEKLAQVAMTAVQQLDESVDVRCPALGYRSIGGIETNAAGLKAAYVIVYPGTDTTVSKSLRRTVRKAMRRGFDIHPAKEPDRGTIPDEIPAEPVVPPEVKEQVGMAAVMSRSFSEAFGTP